MMRGCTSDSIKRLKCSVNKGKLDEFSRIHPVLCLFPIFGSERTFDKTVGFLLHQLAYTVEVLCFADCRHAGELPDALVRQLHTFPVFLLWEAARQMIVILRVCPCEKLRLDLLFRHKPTIKIDSLYFHTYS